MTAPKDGKPGREVDDLSGVETTGHEWDGIKELNNPLPRWWLWTFYGTVIWALAYTIAFPAWPLISSATSGVLGYSSRAEYQKEADAAVAAQASFVARVAETPLADVVADPELARFAQAGGRAAFKVNCSQCHGSGAEGAAGYPNLNDDEWIWGGTIDQIYQTIAHGVRSPTDPDTHLNTMPNFGTDGILDAEQIKSVASYVASLSGVEGGAATPEGEQLFAENCAACHGETGKGMADMGGPDLTDAIWLYQGTLDGIAAQVKRPKHGMMPAWSEKLPDATIRQLAVYVHSLGGGQ